MPFGKSEHPKHPLNRIVSKKRGTRPSNGLSIRRKAGKFCAGVAQGGEGGAVGEGPLDCLNECAVVHRLFHEPKPAKLDEFLTRSEAIPAVDQS